MATEMQECPEIMTIPRDSSVLRTHFDCRDIDNGTHGIAIVDYDFSLELLESSCPSTESEASLLLSGINYGDLQSNADPTDETPIISIGAIDGSINEQKCKASIGASGDKYGLLRPPFPMHEQKLTRYDSDMETTDDEDEAETLSWCAHTEFGDTTIAGLAHQGSNTAVTKNRCATSISGCDKLHIGWDDKIPRWYKGSELKYVVCSESFESPYVADSVAKATAIAISMWQDIGVHFKEVGRNEPATFAIKYCCHGESSVCARSFFPTAGPGELFLYENALTCDGYLANILAHELGHILGLRHEFAAEKEKYNYSVPFGDKNDKSIMNYFYDLSELQVGEQDREELARFYEYGEEEYERLRIANFHPRLFTFRECSGAPAVLVPGDPVPNKLYSAKKWYTGCTFL